MAGESILLIEDEEDILALLHFNLSRHGYHVSCATSGEEGLQAATDGSHDLILLDLMLPGINGLEVCRRLRRQQLETPIIMVTAKGEEEDIVTGLELGADDYITKPFSPRVLLARISAVLRRHLPAADTGDPEILQRGEFCIHIGRNEVKVADRVIDLTFTEFRVLSTLARRPGWVLTRSQIVDAVRGAGYAVTDRAVDVQIVALRKKLGPAGRRIETVRGVGYRFGDPGEES